MVSDDTSTEDTEKPDTLQSLQVCCNTPYATISVFNARANELLTFMFLSRVLAS